MTWGLGVSESNSLEQPINKIHSNRKLGLGLTISQREVVVLSRSVFKLLIYIPL